MCETRVRVCKTTGCEAFGCEACPDCIGFKLPGKPCNFCHNPKKKVKDIPLWEAERKDDEFKRGGRLEHAPTEEQWKRYTG